MKFLLATKEYMTQIYDEEGRVHPATVLSVGEHTVTQVKKQDTDGYTALQVATGERKEKNVNKPQKKKGLFSHFREFRVADESALSLESGATYTLSDAFAEGDSIMVSALSKAKGFQGVVKRHNFAGGPRTHGQKHNERSPGSIGGGLRNRVPKGMRMAGRMGGTRITVKNLTVVKVDAEQGKLYVRGAVPGRRGTLVEVRSA
jgi:large subunit ribosomal protein L3